jgi:methylated-DNA-[protein]-cysteine S-methyltransferase
VHHHVFATALGFVAVAWRDATLAGLRLPEDTEQAAMRAIRRRFPHATEAQAPAPIAATVDLIRRYFAGEHVDFAAIPLDLGTPGDFSLRVYGHIRRLGRGETTTYGAIARDLGAGPEAARAVGQAMATNPVPLIVPCHRVLAAGGALGGFSAPGGAGTKARMLELEGSSATALAQQAFAF